MASQVHKIKRLFIEVEFNGTESEGMKFHRSVSDLFYHSIMPALEEALKRYMPLKDHLTFERFDIDAGTLQLDSLESRLSERVIQALEKSFQELSVTTPQLHFTNTDTLTVKTEGESISDAFLFFLKNGTLPWSFHLPSGATFEETVFKLLKEPERFGGTPDFIRNDVVKVLSSATARKRLIYQFSPLLLETLFRLLSPERAKELRGFLPLFRSSEAFPLDFGRLEQLLWEDAFACIASGKPYTEEKIISAIRAALTLPVFRHLSLDSRFERYRFDVSVIQKVTGLPLLPIPFDDHKTESAVNEKSTLHQTAQDNDESDSLRTIEHPEAKTGIYIVLAGLVLLHPFLPQLFRALAVADDEKLLQPTRALHLLYFLVTGESIAPEYELVLPKILCNISLDATVELEISLTVSEQEEAEALLSAVIRHWEVLKNTSIDGLRETFLKRSGKLSQRSDGEWLLQVESKSYDLLLEQLPWGISMIKLPWMSQMLRVEWI